MKLHIDFETQSEVELTKRGLHNYATGHRTNILCMAYAFDDGPIQLWIKGQPFPADLLDALLSGDLFFAHNAAFEHMIWNEIGVKKYGWPKLPIENLHCTMVMGYGMALPGKLEKLAPALGLKEAKDVKGGRVMMQLSQPREVIEGGCKLCGGSGTEDLYTPCESCGGDGNEVIFYTPESHPDKFEILYKYCIQDVEVERQSEKRTLMLTPKEREIWFYDQLINSRGIRVDKPSVERAIEIIELEKIRLNDEMRLETGNAVATANALADLKMWLAIVHDIKIPTVKKFNKKKGIEEEVNTLDKGDVINILKGKSVSASARRALEIRQEAGKSSTAKLKAMIQRASFDGRVRGAFQYYGAYSTGRWAGRGLQLQNMTRGAMKYEDILKVFELLNSNKPIQEVRDTIDMLYGQPTKVISDCLRSFLISEEGSRFIDVDWNSIEARILAWLAGDEDVLQIFRGHGLIYEYEASKIFKVALEEVSKHQRQIGKVAVLALGYQGGVGAFQSMAKNYNVKIPDKQADEIKKAWREAHPKIVRYWNALEGAALAAVNNPGQIYKAGAIGREVKFRVVGSFLWCQIPSGRAICYPYPKAEMVDTPWGEKKEAVTYMTEDSTSGKWERQNTYGGFFCENITQATARDILAESIPRLENKHYKIIMHVHDEIICEMPYGKGSIKEMSAIMCELPKWATGLPLNADGWEGTRYKKD